MLTRLDKNATKLYPPTPVFPLSSLGHKAHPDVHRCGRDGGSHEHRSGARGLFSKAKSLGHSASTEWDGCP